MYNFIFNMIMKRWLFLCFLLGTCCNLYSQQQSVSIYAQGDACEFDIPVHQNLPNGPSIDRISRTRSNPNYLYVTYNNGEVDEIPLSETFLEYPPVIYEDRFVDVDTCIYLYPVTYTTTYCIQRNISGKLLGIVIKW